jgi:hypothetical protein
MMAFQRESSGSSSGVGPPRPAALTRMSMRPHFATVAATASETEEASATSQRIARASPPVRSISAAIFPQAAAFSRRAPRARRLRRSGGRWLPRSPGRAGHECGLPREPAPPPINEAFYRRSLPARVAAQEHPLQPAGRAEAGALLGRLAAAIVGARHSLILFAHRLFLRAPFGAPPVK